MSALSADITEHVKDTIRQSGPLSVAAFMQQAVSHYYAWQTPFGRTGDFITAPEISQMFGEMIGLWIADLWIKMGRPASFLLLECGPGRGTLMADIVRAGASVEGFVSAAQVVLMENSPALRAVQREALAGHMMAHNVLWVGDLNDPVLTETGGPLVVIGNEFLDALPIRQVQYHQGQWYERLVGLDEHGALVFGRGGVWPLTQMSGHEGDVFEVSPARENFIGQIALLLKARGGAGLFIDYGHDKSAVGDTLQAMKAHQFVDVLDQIGAADLTSHVDFAALSGVARDAGLSVPPIMTQGAFLEALGLTQRAQHLAAQATAAQRKAIESAYARLCAPDQMGTLFKVMGLSAPGVELAGFAA